MDSLQCSVSMSPAHLGCEDTALPHPAPQYPESRGRRIPCRHTTVAELGQKWSQLEQGMYCTAQL